MEGVLHSGKLKGNNRCKFRRERAIITESNKDTTFRKVGVIKAAIKLHMAAKKLSVLPGHFSLIFKKVREEESPKREDEQLYELIRSTMRCMDKTFDTASEYLCELMTYLNMDTVKGYIKENFLTLDFITKKTAMLQAATAAEQVVRYLKDESRTPEYYQAKVLPLFDLHVEVRPDMVFSNEDGSIEAVKLCCRKPDISQSGKKKDSSVNQCMELYAMWAFAKELADDPETEIKASYYFLRREDDRTGNMPEHFFPRKVTDPETGRVHSENGKNVVTLAAKAGSGELSRLYEPQFKEYTEGEECSGKTCENCDFYCLCNYNKAPLSSEEEKEGKKLTDIALTKEQQKAVDFRKGIARINAGAGAGKTLVVTLRTTMMLSEGIDKILLITFTNAGADEMRERIQMYTSEFGITPTEDDLYCTTFNSFGDEIIKAEYERLGFSVPPRVIDEIERKAIITDLLKNRTIKGLDYRNFDMNFPYIKGALCTTAEAFHIIKRDNLSIYDTDKLEKKMQEEGYGNGVTDREGYKELLDLFDVYDNRLREEGLIEFQDQERLLFDLLDLDPYYLDKLGYKHIIVDEYQDTSENQNDLIKKLVESESFESLMVVGDDSQSIFSFREANPENILEFFDILGEEGEDIFIVENHRSTPEIIDFANKLNARNMLRIEKDLIATRPSGKPVTVRGFNSKKAEYGYIAKVISEKIDEGYRAEDIAVIAATRNELLDIASVLADAEVETSICCPEPMLENSRVKGAIAYCRMMQDAHDTQSILEYENCLRDGALLDLSDDEINALIKEDQEMIRKFRQTSEPQKSEAVNKALDELTKGDFLAEDFAERLKRFPLAKDKFLYADRFVRFGGESIKRCGKYSGIVLATAHSSKGLEWPVVINTVTKYDRNRINNVEREERRRLFFVSATRARDELIVTGQYRIRTKKGDALTYNMFLRDAYYILKEEFVPDAKSDKAAS